MDEHTPLIVVVRPQQQQQQRRRYRHHTARRFCTFCLSSILLLALILFLFLLFVVPDCEDFRRHHHRHSKICLNKHPLYRNHWYDVQTVAATSKSLSYDALLDILADTPDEEQIRKWSKYYTSGPHLGGKNLSQAEWTRDRWQDFGITQSEIVSYDIYTSYPVAHRLALLEKSSKKDGELKVRFEASLSEDVLEEDSTSGLETRIPTFHGYSGSGNVTASYVFCNYGTYYDFEDLLSANVSLKGKIALVKYGRIFRGLKVKRAQELGMSGVVIYSDPGDDGEMTEENGYEAYPNGPARNPSSVQRGSVQFLSIYPGDPTTPGYASKPGVDRQSPNATTPKIPSLPISYRDALPLLKALNGYGPKAKSFNKYWQGGGLGHKGVKYNIGPTPDHIQLNLMNEQEYVITPMWNVIGIINGTLSDEVVILGNHRDAWIAGGAGDPNSGSAALNEVARSFGVALAQGWKPLRTIVLASWDGEEYGLLGSTEWVEDHVEWLNRTAVAYLNVDVGADGPSLHTSGAPLLNQALIEATKLVWSPNQTTERQTVYDAWDKNIRTLGSGSDYTAFQDFLGIPSIDMGFTASSDSPVYHYHSNYDSFDWMDKFGDKDWKYHTTITRLWSILAASIIERNVVPLNTTVYAQELSKYLEATRIQAEKASSDASNDFGTTKDAFKPLEKSIDKLLEATVAFDAEAAEIQHKVTHDPPSWWHWWDRVRLYAAVKRVNGKYRYLERHFIYQKGFDSRPWFKHVVFAPGIWTGYAGETFPPLSEAIDNKDKEQVQRWIKIITDLVSDAAKFLDQ